MPAALDHALDPARYVEASPPSDHAAEDLGAFGGSGVDPLLDDV